jgi:hypothetical protein
MEFRIEQHFAGSLGSVEAALIDPAFLDRLASLPQLGHPRLLDQQQDGELVHQRVAYAFVGDLSGRVRAVVDPDRLTWVEESTLHRGTHRTEFHILPDHYGSLLSCRGTFQLRAEGSDRCTRTALGDVRVGVPLVGRKVEAAIVSGLVDHAALEADVMDEWLRSSAGQH